MLVLTRKVQESVIVGDDHGPHRILKVTVLSIQGQRVKLGFEMDGQVPIHRWELWEEIRDAAALVVSERDRASDQIDTGIASSEWPADYEATFEPQEAVATGS